MLQDALLAWIHYLAIFVLVVVMTAEAVLLRRPDAGHGAPARPL